ncbi:IucA/IucC family protein [Bacillus suaedae]|uniref:Siderophore biosynthesis protein n=1 Tax=Halalkalibacter suaedae TaxID=2822140 RepID=A0A941AQG5_9BACI|nr:IucA/IucC family protein [Bacillus suaedae]MBP3952662.1 siderophore biosynthesis protein [Bacillus suaedae]
MNKLFQFPYNKAATRVRRQLVEAILFEGLVEYKVEQLVNEPPLSSFVFGTKRKYYCVGRTTAFNRIRLIENRIFEKLPGSQLREALIEEVLEEVVSDMKTKERILNELLQTVRLCEWNESHIVQLRSRRESSYEELESEITEGHPYHPCFKSRTGFTLDDHERYGPEAKQSFSLKWLAVRRNRVTLSVPEDEVEFWISELGMTMWQELLSQLKERNLTFGEYTFLPVHPWQWKAIQHRLLSESIKKSDILLLDVGGDRYRSTQSVRTLWNESNPKRAYIKLPMNMVNTSSLRKLEPHSVCAAPSISAWIETIIQSDPYLKEEASLTVLKEYAGIMFEGEDGNENKEIEGQLGVIWRESVHNDLKKDEDAVPFTALMIMENDGQPFIAPWLKQYNAQKWVEQLINVSVIPVWHLLVAHGIAVEAHAQNMILVHKNGWPIRVILRDFHESVEFVEEYLEDPSRVPLFATIHKNYKDGPLDQFFWMSSVEALRELVMDTLFVFHLSELSFLLENQNNYREDFFWKQVDQALIKHLELFPHLIERHQQLQYANDQIYVESLLKKKVQNKGDESFRHLVNNVFSEFRQKGNEICSISTTATTQ